MAIKEQNGELWQGYRRVIRIEVANVEHLDDITEAKWAMSLDATSSAVLQKTLGSGITQTGKYLDVLIPAADTVGITPNDYYHEAMIEDAAGNPYPVTVGTLTLHATLLGVT